MTKSWAEVEQSEQFQSLSDIDRVQVKKQYFDNIVSQNKDFIKLPNADKEYAKRQFLGSAYEGELISRKTLGKREFPARVAGVGQFAGGLGGAVLGGLLGHPFIGGAIGGTVGRAAGRIVAQPKVLFNPLLRKKFGQELLTTAGVEAATAPISAGGMKLGRGLIKTFIPKTVAERGIKEGFKKLLNPEFYKEHLPTGFVERVSNIFNKATNKYGELVENTIKQPYYQKKRINLGTLKDTTRIFLKGLGIDDVPSIDKIDTLSQRDREIIKTQIRNVLNLTKENVIPENLWTTRRELDKVIYNKSWKPEALEILNGLRKQLNAPLRNLGTDVAKAFDEYSFIMQSKDALGKNTEDIIRRRATKEIFSQDIENFTKTLMMPEKSETRRLLTSIDPELANEMFDVASAKVLGKQFLPSTPYQTLFGKFISPKSTAQIAGFAQKPSVRIPTKLGFRLLPTTTTDLLTEEE